MDFCVKIVMNSNPPNVTHNMLRPRILKCRQIDVDLEIRVNVFIYNCLNSVKYAMTIAFASLNPRRWITGINFRHLAFIYKVDRVMWFNSKSCVLWKASAYNDIKEFEIVPSYTMRIRI